MPEKHSITHTNYLYDEVDLREFFHVLLEGKWIIVSLTTFASIVGIIYSLYLPNIYQSKAILVPVDSSGGISGAIGGLNSLAGLAGISLPSGGNNSNSAEALQKINSLSFFENNIMPNIYLPDLMAVKSWDSKVNTLSFDENIYNTRSNTWIRDFSHPQQQIPSAQESFEEFKENLGISEDKQSGFITLSVKHQSPFIAKKWVELVVNEINAFYRQKDKSESETALSYLNKQISNTGFAELKQAIAQLIQEETKKLTLIEANQYYVFDYIDPPAVMEKKSEPKRALIFTLSALLGWMLSLIFVLTKHYSFRIKAS